MTLGANDWLPEDWLELGSLPSDEGPKPVLFTESTIGHYLWADRQQTAQGALGTAATHDQSS